MSDLRWGISATAQAIDELSDKQPDELEESELEILAAIRRRAEMVIDSGITVLLDEFARMSRFEMLCLEIAAERRRAIDRHFLASVFGHDTPEQYLPDSPELAEAKAMAEHRSALMRFTHGRSAPNR